MRGRIMKGVAGFYYVYAQNGILYACKARGIFRKEGIKPLAGDEVEMEVTHEGDREGNIIRILPRKNALIRPAIANVDQALVIFSIHDPEPNLLLLDRFLAMMRRQQVPALICFGKADLAREGEREALERIYASTGYRLFFTSMQTGEGQEDLKGSLLGKTTVVAGPSGVGKSSLTNALQTGIIMETGQISRKLKRGRHTTRHCELVPFGENSYLADTPGFTSLSLPSMEETELGQYFPEFSPYADQCRFQGCLHSKEPGCAVKGALETGQVSPSRYENYLALCEEIRSQKRY